MVSDTKEWNGKTWHFCDAPMHKDNIHWYTHLTATCHTCKAGMNNCGSDEAATHVADDTMTCPGASAATDASMLSTLTYHAASDDPDATSLMATALNHTNGNSSSHILIDDALNAFHEEP